MRLAPVAILCALAVGASGCNKTRSCKPDTILVAVSGSAADGADTLSLDISIDGGTPKTVTVAWKNGGGTVEINFPAGYPRNHTVTVAATAQQSGTTLATASATVSLDDSCKTLPIVFGGDVMGDGGADAMCVPSVTSCPATVTCGKIDDGCGNFTVDCGPCQVNASDRAIAAAGDTLTLEGKFADPTVVTFPGGTTAMATLLGANRATVVVPTTAGEGQLSVVANHSAAVTLPFRRSTYALEAQPFRTTYEQLDYARSMPVMSDGRFWSTAVAGDRYVYVLGGYTQNVANGPTSVEQAMINADGTLGPMQLSPNKMTAFHAYAPSLRIGDHIYVFSGNDGSIGATMAASVTNKVDVATINADGTIGVFSAAPATVKATLQIGANTFDGVWGHGAAIIGNWVYLFGGSLGPYCTPAPTNQIERAPINADGTLGDFAILPATLSMAERNGGVVVRGGFVYVVSDTKIQYSGITSTGDLIGFNDAGVTLPNSRAHAAAYALGNAIYLVGGTGGANVLKVPINANGTLAAATVLPGTIAGSSTTNFGSALIGHNLYTFGGGDGNSCSAAFIVFNRSVQRASLVGGTTLGAFTSTPSVNTSVQRTQGFVSAVVGNRVYAIGGQSPSTKPDVDMALVGADGLLGNFTAQANTVVTKRLGASGAVIRNFLYVLGGADAGTPSTYVAAVEVAPIAADGTLGAFAAAKVNGTGAAIVVTTARSQAIAFVVPGDHTAGNSDYLCLAGGSNAAAVTAVECTIINSDGTLAANLAPLAPAVNLVVSRPAGPTAYVGDQAYVFGGVLGGGGAIDAAPYDNTGKLSPFAASVTNNNQSPRRVGWMAGSNAYVAGGVAPLGAYPTDLQTSPIAATGAPANFVTSPTVLIYGRVGAQAAVLGTRVWVYGGLNQLGQADTETAELR